MAISAKRFFRLFIRSLGWFLVFILVLLVAYGFAIWIPAPDVNSKITPASFKRKNLFALIAIE